MERGAEFINGEENDTRVLRNRLQFEITNFGGNKFDFMAPGWITYNSILNSLNKELNRNCTNGIVNPG